MGQIPFVKMHGTGNDFVLIDARKRRIQDPARLAARMCHRHFGIGADGVIMILESTKADFRMRIFNPDGSEAEMCGNGIRCFAKYCYDAKLTRRKRFEIETGAGIKTVECTLTKATVGSVRVDMGEPVLQRERIPMTGPPGMVIGEPLQLPDGTRFEITAISMGNPHAVIFVEELDNFPIAKYGPQVENHHLFPNRTNVEFVKIKNHREIIMRIWERGAGETLACGTGAAAAAVATVLNELTGRSIKVGVKGGTIKIEWRENDNHVYLTGPAVEVFRGEWPS